MSSSIKKLAGQTLWYGVSSIAAKFINLLLTPYLTRAKYVKTTNYGQIGIIYSALTILKVIFTYGFETTYFRFSSKQEHKKNIYNTAFLSLLATTVLFTIILLMAHTAFGKAIGLEKYPDVVKLGILVVGLDSLNAIPFAKLRQENRPIKYAIVNVGGILVNIFFTWLFISVCPAYVHNHPQGLFNIFLIYGNPANNPVTYVMLANVLQSAFTILLLITEIRAVRLKFSISLWKEMIIYSYPLIIVGMGGMVNETFDRLMLGWWLPGNEAFRETQVGIYNACYKLSLLISLSVQAFRMGAEPFFFNQAESGDAQRTYARVMKFFVIAVSVMFLLVSLYIPIWQIIIGPQYRSGLGIVPILLMANICLGIYYNLTIWYKLSNRTGAGATITVTGALITIAVNYVFIPKFGFYASAWATFFCYFSMMVISFVWGQKVYYVPYAWKKLLAYLVIVLLLFFAHKGIMAVVHLFVTGQLLFDIISMILGTIFTLAYLYFIMQVEKNEFARIPYVNRLIRA
ncbi:MAG TPA: oligosaccharide flippase family protein [Chitinophagaceae bacterium]|nr:oligosaccharide flippase family protein [Chitinophagaceae bacterium]